ncbi:MAG: hypothetical protein JXO22_01275, partial [Phycisphaerae bacterium]|nr:hypothetical protein [Phycisphaerae bacterium]
QPWPALYARGDEMTVEDGDRRSRFSWQTPLESVTMGGEHGYGDEATERTAKTRRSEPTQ